MNLRTVGAGGTKLQYPKHCLLLEKNIKNFSNLPVQI